MMSLLRNLGRCIVSRHRVCGDHTYFFDRSNSANQNKCAAV